MKYRAVFFDAGDTLLAPHPSFSELFVMMMAEEGHILEVKQAEKALEEGLNVAYRALQESDRPAWSTSREDSMWYWGTVYQTALARLGISERVKELSEFIYTRFTRYEAYRLFPDALPALEKLKQAGLHVGLISNFEEWLEGMLIEWEIAHLFDSLLISGKEGIEKPDAKIFEAALRRAAVRPDEAIYVGDNPQIDVVGASAVGMEPVLIDRKGRYKDHSGIRIETLDELAEIVGLETKLEPND